MKNKSLLYYLNKVTDRRRAEGKRHSQLLILIIIIMSTMSNFYGYRGIERFIKKNKDALLTCLKPPKDRLPSLATIRRVVMNIDFNELSNLFKEWAMQQIELENDQWISIDGKSLRNTMLDYNKPYQNFVSIVSAFCHKSGIVISIDSFHNKKISEIVVVDQMIESLGIQGVVFTMDAIHCKKNSDNNN